MNFNIDLSFTKTPYVDKENCLSDRNTHQSYRSNSYGISPVKKNMSINKNNEAKQQAIINFKQNFRTQRGFSGQATNSTCSADKSTSRFSAEKKSKFRLEFEPKSTATKSTNKFNAKSPISSTQRVRQNTPSIPNFKKKSGVGLRKSVTQAQNSTRRFMFNQTTKDNNPIISEQNTKIQKQLFKQLKISDFVIGKFLGKGIYGEVFFVRHKLTRWIMAMKTINKTRILNNQKLINQTVEEIKIHSFVKHPNICSMYGFFSDQTNVYLLLELCTDKSLYSIMKTQKVLPQEKAIQIINQLTKSLDYLHSNDIIHRDIKPENVLLNCDIIKLTDFGWSAYCSDGMRSTVCGTPLYLSPQLIKGQQYNSQTDIWALGILSYELICGRTPFKIKQQSHLTKIINDQIQFPLNKQISQNYKDFVTKCLQKQQQKRANISELSFHPILKNQDSIYLRQDKTQM